MIPVPGVWDIVLSLFLPTHRPTERQSESDLFPVTCQSRVTSSTATGKSRRTFTIVNADALSPISTAILDNYYICLKAFFQDNLVSWHQKGKPFCILMTQETTGIGGISWATCISFAARPRHIHACTSPLSYLCYYSTLPVTTSIVFARLFLDIHE